jgi:hypothetical protein
MRISPKLTCNKKVVDLSKRHVALALTLNNRTAGTVGCSSLHRLSDLTAEVAGLPHLMLLLFWFCFWWPSLLT